MSATTTSQAPAVAGTGNERFLLEREKVLGPLMLLPAVFYIVALVGIPLVLAVLYAFTNVTVGDPRIDGAGDFVGLDNFRAVLSDSVFRQALR
ncbi:MAG: sugar ABC transporter permease, partial [Actinomycetota bacterium]|nr:sugar ABC transporter permease [Actinomycetota bacterium]